MPTRRVLVLADVVKLALLGAGGRGLPGSREAEARLRADRLAIATFRAADEVACLEEVMLDLLAAKLTGEGGLRAVAPAACWTPARATGWLASRRPARRDACRSR